MIERINKTLRQNQFNTSSNLRDNSTVEVSSRVEENLFTIDDKWVTNERTGRNVRDQI